MYCDIGGSCVNRANKFLTCHLRVHYRPHIVLIRGIPKQVSNVFCVILVVEFDQLYIVAVDRSVCR